MSQLHDRLKAYADFFETLRSEDLERLDTLFSETVHFKDPFNDVRGLAAVKRVFAHMFERCVDPRFHVADYCGSGDRGYLEWRFEFSLAIQGRKHSLEGLSRITFDADGRVCEHIDYWDPAEQIYSRLPILGWILGHVRNRLSATTKDNVFEAKG